MKRPVGLFLIFCAFAFAAISSPHTAFTPYRDAKPILQALAEILPSELRDADPKNQEEAWNAWAVKQDEEIRARLAQGDADSLVNLLMFGTSFTKAPRLTAEQLKELAPETGAATAGKTAASSQTLLEKRIADMIEGMAKPAGNGRLEFARKTLEAAGIDFLQTGSRQKARAYLYENLLRVIREQAGFQQAEAEARNLDATAEFAEISKLYKGRGLSLDTSLPPNFAIEEALKDMRDAGLLTKGSIKRIGVIGPGLDFTDKHEGYDFYPVQTVQPFAVTDSVLRLGLGRADSLEVDVLDLSPRILHHAEKIAAAARQGRGYVIQLPMDPARSWQPNLVEYWKHFGDQIGDAAVPAAVPGALKRIRLRAIRVRPQYVRRMKTFDVNVVTQRAEFARSEEKFDLLIATNILVYYDTFGQSLALANIAAMLKPGGYLLTNDLLLELPGSRMRSKGYTAVKYSAGEREGDTIVRYCLITSD